MSNALFSIPNTLYQALVVRFRFIMGNYFKTINQGSRPSQSVTRKHIVILGASYAGISTAHRILKHTSKTGVIKITIVSPNTHFYWSMASSRGVVPGKLADDQLFEPIAPGFLQYLPEDFEFVLASATALDVETKTVQVISSSGTRTLGYDFLILATGSQTKNQTPFKGLNTTEETRNALHDFQNRIEEAKTIAVAGGGVTSVEVAGELASEYGGRKRIVLVRPKAMSLQTRANANVRLFGDCKWSNNPAGKSSKRFGSGDKRASKLEG